jgi:serine/threonine protein kinase
MSGTDSPDFLEQTTLAPRSTGDAAKAHDVADKALFERLGVGGMGEVYRFGDDALQRDLAIKVLKSELRGNGDAEQRFLREARLAGSLDMALLSLESKLTVVDPQLSGFFLLFNGNLHALETSLLSKL